MQRFEEFGLHENVLDAIKKLGFEEPTPIQNAAIPLALEGRDLMGQAPTGTGKTMAFGIPLAHLIDQDAYKVEGLVVTPTRELAIQVAEELNRVGQYKKIRTLPIYGGQDISRQINGLKKRPQIVVGTPGRLMDHIRRRTLRLADIMIVVLDEADEMLNMGFIDDIKEILSHVPAERQTLLFSATIPQAIADLASQFMSNPETIRVTPKQVTIPSTEQHYIEVAEARKFDVLCNLLDVHSPESAIVFGRTKRRVDELAEALNKRGYSAEGLHGDLSQSRRDAVMNRFRSNAIEILVATDVAARGLDISGVSYVYNFDIPQDPESYVHRIGRTGRAGQTGVAITLVTPREIGQIKTIEHMTNRKLNRHPAPTLSDALAGQQQAAVERLRTTAESKDNSKYHLLAEELLEEIDSVSLVSAALRLLTKEPNTSPVNITAETSSPGRGHGNRSSRYQPRQQSKKPRYPTNRRKQRRRWSD